MGTRAKLLMFIGAVCLAVLMFVNWSISFAVWATFFAVGMLITTAGIFLGLFELAKSMKKDKLNK